MHFVDLFLQEAQRLEKRAFVPEVARAGAKLVGKSQAKQDVAEAVARKVIKDFQKPVKKKAWSLISKLEAPATRRLRAAGGSRRPTNVQKKLMKGVIKAMDNPEFVLAQPVPIPGASVAAVGLKRGAERLARKYAPRSPAAIAA